MRLRFAVAVSLALLVRPPSAPAQSAVVTLPRFRATHVRVMHDTAWFFVGYPPREYRKLHTLVAYVPATGDWITTLRRWSTVDTLENYHPRSGVLTTVAGRVQPLGAGFSIVDDSRWENDDTVGQYSLIPTSRPRLRPRLSSPPTARRDLYAQGGGRWPARLPAPSFSHEPTAWAAANGMLALAFPSLGPPERPWFWTQEADTGQWRYPVRLSGVLLVDSATLRLTSLAHPALIERDWLGMELVGRRLFVAPGSLKDARYDTHAAAMTATPPLARYDVESKRWTIYRPGDLPFSDTTIVALASDERRLYAVTDNAIGVLDVTTNVWSTRSFVDADTVLSDGADSAITQMVRDRPPAETKDSVYVHPEPSLERLVSELRIRHATAFSETLLRLVPVDTLAETSLFLIHMDGRPELGDIEPPFGAYNAAMARALADPEFEPFLREAMWHTHAQDFALGVLRRVGDDRVVDALRATLDSGSADAALNAADSLLRRRDTTAIVWLRQQVARAEVPLEFEPTMDGGGLWPFARVVRLLATYDDTASLPALMALFRPPDSKLTERAQRDILDAMLAFPSDDARRRIAAAVSERRWLRR